MPERRELPRPIMGGGASFDTNQARRQLHKKRQNTTALQLLPDNPFACRINAVNLENRLRDVETDGRDRFHVAPSESWSPHRQPLRWRFRAGGRSRPQHQYRLFKKVELMIAEEYETGNELELPTQL